MAKKRFPIIVGAGQVTNHERNFVNAPHPLELAASAVEAAIEDSRCTKIRRHVDTLGIVNITSWHYKDPPRHLSEMLDIQPAVREYTGIGGNTPQWLVNRYADRIAEGKTGIAIVAGAEAMDFSYRALREGYPLPWPTPGDVPSPTVGDSPFGSNDYEITHNAYTPIQVYPLFENALRAERGLDIDKHREFLSRHLAEFSRIAAENPLAWSQRERSASEIGTVTEENRIIGFPYTKFMNPVMKVNQSAALIIASTEMAETLAIPKDRWVYLHGGADANDKWFVSERIDFTSSPAIEMVAHAALQMAGLESNEIDFFDLYSCFPSATVIGAKSLGLDMENLPPLTVTGGLAYFGGPGNNYTTHAIAEAVKKLREKPESFGYISALGWFITKHSAGIYSGREPEKPWDRRGLQGIQMRIDTMEGPEIEIHPGGSASVETYTVMHDREGTPDYAIIAARLDNGKRCWAQTQKDEDFFSAMEREEFIGRKGAITAGVTGPNMMTF
jgi:acetyl-CoA C-acetyltransferase